MDKFSCVSKLMIYTFLGNGKCLYFCLRNDKGLNMICFRVIVDIGMKIHIYYGLVIPYFPLR